jgi:hypothetical protein
VGGDAGCSLISTDDLVDDFFEHTDISYLNSFYLIKEKDKESMLSCFVPIFIVATSHARERMTFAKASPCSI